MTLEVNKNDLIALLKGYGVPYEYTYGGVPHRNVQFTGNQWNENWDWTGLDKLDETELFRLYEVVKKFRNVKPKR